MTTLHRLAAFALTGLWSLSAGPASIAAVVSAGNHSLAPNMAGQQIAILVTGGEAVAGIDLFVQVGDGGAAAGGVNTGPTITQVDLAAGAIFGANNTGVFVDPAPLLWGATTTTAAGTVAAAGRLATLTIDTSGFLAGRYDLILNPPVTGPTQLIGAATTLVNGSLQIGAPQASGDFDEDGDVDGADMTRWQAGYGTGATHIEGNADGDADVDGADFLEWQRQVGGASSQFAASATPEPATSWLLASAALGFAKRGRGGRPRSAA